MWWWRVGWGGAEGASYRDVRGEAGVAPRAPLARREERRRGRLRLQYICFYNWKITIEDSKCKKTPAARRLFCFSLSDQATRVLRKKTLKIAF